MEAALSIYRPSIEIGTLGWIVTWFITFSKDVNCEKFALVLRSLMQCAWILSRSFFFNSGD